VTAATMNDHFAVWFNGNADACTFAAQLWTAIQEWDDLEDSGKCENHNALLSWLAFGKEYQPFFAQNAHILRPALLGLYLKWSASNVLDRGTASDVCKSYMLRAGYYDVLHVIAWICGGDEWAVKVGPEIYRSYGESPSEIWQEFNNA